MPPTFKTTLEHWPVTAQTRFETLREAVHSAAEHGQSGPLIETLKWGQPSWLPAKPRVGSTLRCSWSEKRPHKLSLYVNCQTSLLETIRSIYPDSFRYEGNRALHFDLDAPMPVDAIEHCALLTLTYHRKTA